LNKKNFIGFSLSHVQFKAFYLKKLHFNYTFSLDPVSIIYNYKQGFEEMIWISIEIFKFQNFFLYMCLCIILTGSKLKMLLKWHLFKWKAFYINDTHWFSTMVIIQTGRYNWYEYPLKFSSFRTFFYIWLQHFTENFRMTMAKWKSFSIPLCKQVYILGTGNTLHKPCL
jgi:hypothetical protein